MGALYHFKIIPGTETGAYSLAFLYLPSPVPRLLLVLIGGWTVVSILACILGAGNNSPAGGGSVSALLTASVVHR